jgi:hypothetical protein
MILFVFFASVCGQSRGPRPYVEETTPIYDDAVVENLLLNIAATIVESNYDINTINEIIFSNFKKHNEDITPILSTIISPVHDIHQNLEKSIDCTKIFHQYGFIFISLVFFTAALNLVGIFSVMLSWKKNARYKFPENAFRKSSTTPESVSLVSNKETFV